MDHYLIIFLVSVLVLSNGIWTWLALHTNTESKTHETRTMLKSLHWDTPYSSDNKTSTNILWKDLFPSGQGLVALSNDEAMARRLPASVKHNNNASESVYFVAAYHQIHCLTVIRAALYHFSENMTQTVPLAHTLHCLDSLRQEVMCHADDDLLYTDDGKIFGDGQVRQCRDWDGLREWTERNKI